MFCYEIVVVVKESIEIIVKRSNESIQQSLRLQNAVLFLHDKA
jgi:hypothetical protein